MSYQGVSAGIKRRFAQPARQLVRTGWCVEDRACAWFVLSGFTRDGMEVVEIGGLEPPTSSLRTMRSPS